MPFLFLLLFTVHFVRSTCGGCELTDDDLDSYCAADEGGGTFRCYSLPEDAFSLHSVDEDACTEDPETCDHHGRGCGPNGECLCPPNSLGATCRRFVNRSVQRNVEDVVSIVVPNVLTGIVCLLLGMFMGALLSLIGGVCCCNKREKEDCVQEVDMNVELVEVSD